MADSLVTPDEPTQPTGLADTAADPDSQGTTNRAPRVAATLAGYELGELIGRGGMGEVVAAHDRWIEREVAVKRMREGTPTPEAIARFLREARIQARLDHPAIVPVHELGTDDHGLPYFTMKRLAGTTLAARLAQQPAAIQPLLRAFVDVCFAIELAHTRGVVHRDLKPSNIMLGDYGEVYVLDWGVARVLSSARTSSVHMPIESLQPSETATGTLLGTPGYMAPEQMRGEDVGTAADVYALGSILFEILTGAPLHPLGKDAFASTLATGSRSPAERYPDKPIAPELATACSDALADDPAQRPTARVLAERVQQYLDGDRDLDHRRRLAAEQLAAARAALESGSRADAIHRAGRALALDPESLEAAELVTALIVEPPAVPPPELERELQGEEGVLERDNIRRGARAYLAVWVVVPLLPLLHVASWALLAGTVAASTAMAGVAWWSLRRGSTPLIASLVGNLLLVTMFSRIAGPFVMTPLLVCGVMLAIGANRAVDHRPWIPMTWLVIASLVPILLEVVGVLAPTWRIQADGLLSHGTIFDQRTSTDAVGVTIGTLALSIVVGRFILMLTRSRRDSQRKTQIQAWHLKQLLPREARRTRS